MAFKYANCVKKLQTITFSLNISVIKPLAVCFRLLVGRLFFQQLIFRLFGMHFVFFHQLRCKTAVVFHNLLDY